MRSVISVVERRTGRLLPAAPDGSVALSSAALGWRGLAAELHRMGAGAQPEHYVGGHRLMVHAGPPTRFERREGDGPWRAATLGPGDVTLLGHGAINEPRWHGPFEFLALALDPAFAAAAFGDDSGALAFAPQLGRADPAVARLAGLLRRELADPLFAGRLFGEVAALALARHLIAAYGTRGGGRGPAAPRGALGGARLGRVLERLRADLAGDVGLEALAAEACVSPFHFARQLRAATGLSPHQLVLRLRIAHAQRLIRSRRGLTLAEVAVAAGFYDQAHLTRTFRRVVGVTPGAFAAGCR